MAQEVNVLARLISTHALTWRATSGVQVRQQSTRYFYPRPHMEGDSQSASRSLSFWNFYPRPHMEGDPTTNRGGAKA